MRTFRETFRQLRFLVLDFGVAVANLFGIIRLFIGRESRVHLPTICGLTVAVKNERERESIFTPEERGTCFLCRYRADGLVIVRCTMYEFVFQGLRVRVIRTHKQTN